MLPCIEGRFGNSEVAPLANMAWYVYLIECKDGSIYTGISVDVGARYAAHVSGKGARYTRSHPPRSLLATIEYPDRSAASIAEYQIKQLSPSEKRAFGRLHGIRRKRVARAKNRAANLQ